MESNPKALRGYSRDHRPDCKQVTIGAVVDREGYPVGYEVLAGNVRDHKTVAGMLQRLGARFGLADRTLCMDRGMVTQDSLKLIRESTVRYVLADRRGAPSDFRNKCSMDSGRPSARTRIRVRPWWRCRRWARKRVTA